MAIRENNPGKRNPVWKEYQGRSRFTNTMMKSIEICLKNSIFLEERGKMNSIILELVWRSKSQEKLSKISITIALCFFYTRRNLRKFNQFILILKKKKQFEIKYKLFKIHIWTCIKMYIYFDTSFVQQLQLNFH